MMSQCPCVQARRDPPPRSPNAKGSVAVQDSHRPVRPSTGSTAGGPTDTDVDVHQEICSRECDAALFGHILRMPDGCPAVAAMINYYQVKEKVWRGRPRTTLPIVLSRDRQRVGRRGLKTLSDLLSLREIVQGRGEWKDLCKNVYKSNGGVYD